MANTISEKIIKEHLVEGKVAPGEEIAIKIDQTLTQDATGTMAYLQFEALGIDRVRTELATSYVDHNMLQTGFENADDHRFLQSVATKYGIYFSRPGNGICHQVHLERFAAPGKTLLGSDSHTPTAGGMGSLAIGAGGLDVAVAMGGGPFYFKMPKILGVELQGRLQPWVSAKDIILEVLRRMTVKGGVGKILEYHGEGIQDLDVPSRSTITNMTADGGATTAIFPSDLRTKEYLQRQNRVEVWKEVGYTEKPQFDELMTINLNELEPLIAKPHSPDNVVKVSEVAGTEVSQVVIGSCTNSSLKDLMTVAKVLEGKTVHPNISLGVVPGSRQVYEEIARNGALATFVKAGARILESACGPCIGMGFAPSSNGVSLRTFNRNFEGRAGTKDARVYLVSPEVAAAAAITGVITDPRTLGAAPKFDFPEKFIIDDSMILTPPKEPNGHEVIRGPNIKPLPKFVPLANEIKAEILIKVGDNITTDHIMPAGSKILPLRSNIPAISEYVFERVDTGFVKRAKEKGSGFIIGGENYGQGSSREHAALAPMYLGVKAVIVKSFARIHKSNLINFGIVPLTFAYPQDYDKIEQGDVLEFRGIKDSLAQGSKKIIVRNVTKGTDIETTNDMSPREIKILIAGGLLNYTKMQQAS